MKSVEGLFGWIHSVGVSKDSNRGTNSFFSDAISKLFAPATTAAASTGTAVGIAAHLNRETTDVWIVVCFDQKASTHMTETWQHSLKLLW